MEEKRISGLLSRLDGSGSDSEWQAVEQLCGGTGSRAASRPSVAVPVLRELGSTIAASTMQYDTRGKAMKQYRSESCSG